MEKAMPELNIPPSDNKTKSMVKNLDLDCEKIDACPNNCMLFRNDHKNDEFCHTCGASHYMSWSLQKKHRVSVKTLRHFPLIPRLKRQFMCSKTADSLRLHDEECSKDGKLRHLTDGLAWKDFDRLHPDFTLDCHNVRLGLSSDGFNPFRILSLSHSTWSVMLMHNLLRHNLDVMHIEKNIVDSILGSLLDISSKTKDHAEDRYDLKDMEIRKNLHPKDTEDSKRTKFAKACFSMTNGEKSIFCGVLKTTKLPDGSASNISRESIQEKGIKLPMNNSRFRTSFKEGVTASVHLTRTTLGNGEIHNEHDIHDLPNCKQVKRNSVIPANSLDEFHNNQGIHIDDETKCDNHTIADVEFMHAPIINEHNKGLDDLVDQEELGGDECDVEEEIYIDCSKKVEGKKWVMTGLRDAWSRHKQKINEKFYDKNSTLEDMLAKCPDGIPDNQFRHLIKYWKHPTVQRAAKDNNEEPSKLEMFIANRTKTGKEIQGNTQVAAELQNRQNSGERTDDAFKTVFGKEQPVTRSSLKKDEEINILKQKHANEMTSLKEELRKEMRHLFTQLLQ
ncbi:hypothetical protein RDI58_029041 [Solanum bulbocastanum]|uniref:Uncharacterized protein n=1 Tax=Solanum bulbocastanum TaxID=147425 RepID=A0AAN8Y1R1_SOLBU